MPEIVESTAVELEPVADHSLFETRDPIARLQAAKRVAAALKAELEAGGMVVRIGNGEHVRVEGWQTLATMAGLTSRIAWSRPLEDGWEARAEVLTADGRVISAGESMCTRAERNWARSDEFAIRSMSETRAISRGLRNVLAFVMVLSGHEATPAEEITDAPASEPAPAVLPEWAQPADKDQRRRAAEAVAGLLEAATGGRPTEKEVNSIGQAVRDQCGGVMPRCVALVLVDIAATAVITNKTEAA